MFKSFLNYIELRTHHAPYVVHGMVYGKVQIKLLILKFKIISLWILKFGLRRLMRII